MIDLNPSHMKNNEAAQEIGRLIDLAIQQKEAKNEPRDYVGASSIGDPCSRKLQYQQRIKHEFPPRILRIFQRGHHFEELIFQWLKDAGFLIRTHKQNGRQIGFVSGNGKFKGHCDGVIIEAPGDIKAPCLLELKVLGRNGFDKLEKNGVEKQYPVYATQMSVYQEYLDLPNPAVFIALCADDMRLHIELVKRNLKRAQEATDKAVNIIKANEAGELLPRPYADSSAWGCRFCNFKEECWDESTTTRSHS
jgi:hypothetical protein